MEDLLAYLEQNSKTRDETIIGTDKVLELDWDEDVAITTSSGILSDDDVHHYLREMNEIPAGLESGKQLKDWTDCDLMVFMAFNQIPQEVVLKVFGQHIGGSYFIHHQENTSDMADKLVKDCSISEEHAREIVQLVGKMN